MSSVVNKSKNKFAPKAKVRPRPGVVAPRPPAPNPPEDPIPAAVPEFREKMPAPLPTPPPTLHQADTETTSPSGPRGGSGVPTLQIAVPTIRTGSEERHSEPRQHSVVPTLRTVYEEEEEEENYIEPTPYSQGISSIRPSTAQIPPIRTTAAGEEPGAQTQLKAKPRATRTRPKGKVSEKETDHEAEVVEEVADEDSREEPEPITKKKNTAKRKVKTTPGGEPATKRKSLIRRKKPTTEGDNAGGDTADQPEGEAGEGATPKAKKRAPAKPRAKGTDKPRGRRRAGSPEDGESQEIAVNVVKMKDLCKDMKIGKKSKRFLELQQADWTKLAKEQQEKQDVQERIGNTEEEEEEEEGEHETVDKRLERLAGERNRKATNAPQMRIVNDQIVLDAESLRVDRRERDAADEGIMEIVEENQNSRRVTSQTWSKREKVEKWDAAQTERFYEALSMFGTDFEIISRMFAGRSRRQMRNKFNNEERRNPKRITEALRTRISVNIEEYSAMADQEFQDPKDLEEELRRLRDEHEAEEVAAIGHAVAAERERQEVANAAMHEGDNVAAVEQGKKTRKKKGAKGVLGTGQEEVLMSREEYEEQRARELALEEEL